MAQSKNNMIEEAMDRADGPDTIPVDTRSAWRREQDRTLRLRLEQMQITQNQQKTPTPPIVPPAPAGLKTPARSATQPGRALGWVNSAGALLSVALLASLVGAGLMWLALDKVSPIIQPSLAALSVPVLATEKQEPQANPVMTPDLQVRDVIEGWRQAWSRRDASAYLTYYGHGFVPANGQKLTDWSEGRRRNFSGKSSIQVAVIDLRVESLSDGRIKAFFLQDYAAGNYREDRQPKTLLLEHVGDGWKIKGEWEGDHAVTPQVGK